MTLSGIIHITVTPNDGKACAEAAAAHPPRRRGLASRVCFRRRGTAYADAARACEEAAFDVGVGSAILVEWATTEVAARLLDDDLDPEDDLPAPPGLSHLKRDADRDHPHRITSIVEGEAVASAGMAHPSRRAAGPALAASALEAR